MTHTVHTFTTTREAYDASQTSDAIKDGDVLVATDERVVGILIEAWPVVVCIDDIMAADQQQFHRPKMPFDHIEGGKYMSAAEAARDAAVELFDVPVRSNLEQTTSAMCMNHSDAFGGPHPLGWYSPAGRSECGISGVCESCFDIVCAERYCEHDTNRRGETAMTSCPICDKEEDD